MDGCINGSYDWMIDGWMDRAMDGMGNEWIDGWMDGWMYQIHGLKDCRMDC